MEKKSGKIVFAAMGRLIIIGFTAQIIFGICYIVKNLGYVQLFGDTAANVAVSGTLSCNVYTGVIYPAVLLLIRAIGMAFNLSWYSFMYLLQLSLAICAGYFFLKAFGRDRFKKVFYFWGSLVIATFPFMLQSHMAILADSFALSFLMLEIAYVRNAWGSRSMTDAKAFCFDLGRACLFWMLASLTEWDLLIVGGIPVLILLVRAAVIILRTTKKGIVFPFIIVILFAVITVGSYGIAKDRNVKALPTKSIEVSLFDRVCWKVFLYHGGLRLRIWEAAGDEPVDEARIHRSAVKTALEPAIEENLGTKEANKLYLDMAKDAWETNRSEILHDTAIDFAGYMAGPIITRKLLSGTDFISFTARNYDIFKRNSPVLAKYYMDFSLFWFEVSLMIAAVLWILRGAAFFRKNKNPENAVEGNGKGILGFGAVLTALLTAIILAVRNVFLGCGVYDYKLAGFSTALWILMMLMATEVHLFSEKVVEEELRKVESERYSDNADEESDGGDQEGDQGENEPAPDETSREEGNE